MTVTYCDRCEAKGLIVATYSGGGRLDKIGDQNQEFVMVAKGDLCDSCRDALKATIVEFFKPLPKAAEAAR